MVSNGSDLATATPRPVIGLTTYLEQAKQGVWDVRAAFLPQQYFDSVTASGGIRSPTPPAPTATRGSSPCSEERRSDGCRCWRSAADSSS